MTTINLAARLSNLNAAIAAAQAAANANPPIPEGASWLDQLNTELAALNALPDDQKDDSAFQSAAMLWASKLGDAAAVQKSLAADPAFLAQRNIPLTSDVVAQAVAMFPRRPFMWSSTPGANVNMMSELFQEGQRWWLNQPADTRPALSEALAPLNLITVLLPVTIETRFYAPDADHASWRVRVRVSPDDISINRHRPLPSTEERDLLGNLRAGWGAAKQEAGAAGLTLDGYLATPNGTALWRTLSNAVQPARAAWLVGSTSTVADLNDVPVDDEHHPQHVDGFPDQIEVWIVRSGQPGPEQIGAGSPVKRDELVFNLSKDDMQAWWNSWDKAVEVGIGIECPLPGEPEQIESLYVVGVSDENPAELFADKAASGDLAVLEPGAPTNTVHGEPAANLAKDPDTWQKLAEIAIQHDAANPPDQTGHSGALTGRADALPPIPSPGLNPDPDDLAQILVGALFPALWGHTLKDLWGLGEGAERLGAWMFDWVRPEGHLLPIRSGDQPYGLVPASSQNRWEHSLFETRRSPGLELVEPDLNKATARLRDGFARAARARGSTVDADTQTLMTLVGRTPTAVGYSYQPYLPVSLIEEVLRAIPGLGFDAARQADLEKRLTESYLPGHDVRGDDPRRFYTAIGDVRDIHMPLILPLHFAGIPPEKAADLPIDERVRHTITVLKTLEDMRSIEGGVVKEHFGGVLPDSLLFRLLIQSVLQAKADAAQAGLPQTPGHGTGPRLEDPTNTSPLLYQWTSQMTLNNSMQVDLDSQAGRIYELVHKSVDMLIELLQRGLDDAGQPGGSQPLIAMVARMERVFKNVLDSAATRIDPFVTALAWRRLNTLRGEVSTSYRLGIYGWVDSPKRGHDGPLSGGLLHAPSQAQLVTSIILRDRYLTERGFDGGAGKAWQMSITSRHVRLAEELAEEVRMGGHIREVLGRRVEAIIGDQVKIQQLRTTAAPLRAASPDRFVVCNGEAVLDLFVNGKLSDSLSADPDLQASQREQLQAWVEAMDVYADLLVAQGVQQAVTRRAEAGSGTMNAAAGTGLPPTLEVIQTPRAGQSVLTSVLAVLPFVDTPTLAAGQEQAAHPAQLADASVAAYVDATFGPPESWKWSFHLTGQRKIPGGGADGGDLLVTVDETQDITLADLDMTPMDAALFAPDRLRFAAEQAIIDQVTASIPDLVRLDVDHTKPIPAPDGERHRLAREVIAALSGAPFEFNRLHVAATPDRAGEIANLDGSIRKDLLDRLAALVTAGAALSAVLADPAQAAAGLRLALRWGIVPVDASQPVEDRAQQAAGALASRIQKAQDFLAQASAVIAAPMANAAAPNAAGKTPQASAGQIAEAIKELAAPEGQLAILSGVSKDDLVNYEPGHALQAAPKLDEAWLTVVAPLRAPLARLEALQLEPLRAGILGKAAAFNGFTTYANRLDDPWQKGPVSENRDQSRTNGRAFQPSRLIAAYGTVDALNGGRTAAGSIDSWGETVPEPRHTTQAGFHFNAPGARAPQAVLIAVPPVVDQPVDTRTLLEVVRETRDLAHARMAAQEDLAAYSAVLPLAMLSTPDPWNRILLDDGTVGPS